MKLRLISLAMLALLAFSSCKDKLTGPPNNPTSSDTIAFYPHPLLDAHDATGHGHDGRALYAQTEPLIYNRLGQVMGGGSDVFEVDNVNGLAFTKDESFTLSVWIKTTDTTDAGIITKGAPGYHGYQLNISHWFGGNASLWIQNANDDGMHLSGSTVVADGQWHLLTLAVTAHVGVTLFVDSSVELTVEDTVMAPDLHTTAAPLLLGSDPNANNFRGLLDEIVIYHHSLSPAEVDARFHEGGWYEHTGSTGHDSTGTGTTISFVQGATIGSGVLDLTWTNGGRTGFACGKNGSIWKSADSGKSWNQIAQSATHKDLYAIRFDQVSKNWGIAVGDDAQGAGIVYTTDTGATWNTAPPPPGIATLRGAAYALFNRTAVGSDSAGNGVILFSSDPFGGTVWKIERHTPKPLFGVASSNNDEDISPVAPLIAVGDAGQIFITTTMAINGDSTRWIDKSSSSENLRKISYSFNSNSSPFEAVAISDQGSTLWSMDQNVANVGNTWIPRSGGATSGAIYAPGNNEAWLAADKILHTTNAGVAWNDVSPQTTMWVCISQPPGHLAFVTQSGQLYWLK